MAVGQVNSLMEDLKFLEGSIGLRKTSQMIGQDGQRVFKVAINH